MPNERFMRHYYGPSGYVPMMLPPSFVNIRGDIARAEDSLEAAKDRLTTIENEYEALCLKFNNYAQNARLIRKMLSIGEQHDPALRLIGDLAKEGWYED